MTDVRTASGSVYRVDFDTSTVVRLEGKDDATPRIQSGRQFKSIAFNVGAPMLVVWGFNEQTQAVELTTTSDVVEIYTEGN